MFHEGTQQKEVRPPPYDLYMFLEDLTLEELAGSGQGPGQIHFTDEKELSNVISFISDWSEHVISLTDVIERSLISVLGKERARLNEDQCTTFTKNVEAKIKQTIGLLKNGEIKNCAIITFLESAFENVLCGYRYVLETWQRIRFPKISTKLRGLIVRHEDVSSLLRKIDVINEFLDASATTVYILLGYVSLSHSKGNKRHFTFSDGGLRDQTYDKLTSDSVQLTSALSSDQTLRNLFFEFQSFVAEEFKKVFAFLQHEIKEMKRLLHDAGKNLRTYRLFYWPIIERPYVQQICRLKKGLKMLREKLTVSNP